MKNKIHLSFTQIQCRDKPCSECPFTNKSLPGYFGPYENIAELVAAGTHDNGYACHTDIQKGSIVQCAGAAAYMKVTGKRSTNMAIRELVRKVDPFTELVFRCFAEMVDHHSFWKGNK